MRQREISSQELQSSEDIPIGAEIGRLDLYDGLSTPFSGDVIALSAKHIDQIQQITLDSILNYGPNDENGQISPEPTFVQQEFGIPTMLARVDCSIDAITGDIVAYEVEDSPSGTGISDRIHKAAGSDGLADAILEHYQTQLGQIPFVIVSGKRGHGTDDKIVLGQENYFYETGNMDIPATLGEDQLVIVKAIPGQPDSLNGYNVLQDRSVCTMESEGDKTYGERIGMHQPILDAEELRVGPDGLVSQAVKRAIGSMAMGIKIYLDLPDRQTFGSAGTVTATKLKRMAEQYIADDGRAYAQEFRGPIRVSNPENRSNLILRVYNLIEPGINGVGPSAKVIGGCYVARQELVVHGASNAVSGAVILES